MREVLEDSEIPKDMNFIHFLTSSVSEIPRTIETLCLGRRNHNSSHETRRWRGRAIAPVLLKRQRVVNHADLAKSQIVTQEVWGGAGGSTFLTSSQAGGILLGHRHWVSKGQSPPAEAAPSSSEAPFTPFKAT